MHARSGDPLRPSDSHSVLQQRSQATLANAFGLLTTVPRDLARLVKDARRGRMRIDLDLKRLDSFGERLHNTIDRMTSES